MCEEQQESAAPEPLPEEDHLQRSRPDDPCLGRALSLVRHLRRHCPWDARQTPRSLRPYLQEEAEEVARAVATGDDGALSDELGDLLLNVAYQIVLAEERGAFDARAVMSRLEAKMKARHPHVYGEAEEAPDWETLKAREGATGGREGAGADSGAAGRGERRIDPLRVATRAQERAAARSFDWPDVRGPLDKVREEVAELEALTGEGADPERVREEVGDLLFVAVNVARLAGVDPSGALLEAVTKFRDRLGRVLELADERGLDTETASLEELDALWEQVKSEERR